MNRRSAIFNLSAIAALGFGSTAILPSPAHAQTAKDLVGTWQHAGNVNIAVDGKKTDTFGPNPKGMAIFSADGHFMIINLRNDLPRSPQTAGCRAALMRTPPSFAAASHYTARILLPIRQSI